MDTTRLEDLIFGTFLGVVTVVLIAIALRSLWARDREAVNMSAGLGLMTGFFALILCTGWVNILPLPK